jgi:hypothetical protein
MDASLMKARQLAAGLSYRVAMRRHCLILLKLGVRPLLVQAGQAAVASHIGRQDGG